MEQTLLANREELECDTSFKTEEDPIVPVTVTGKKGYLWIKRGFDVLVSLAALLILCIPLLLICLAVRLETPGPAIFKQKRMGRNGKVFTMT